MRMWRNEVKKVSLFDKIFAKGGVKGQPVEVFDTLLMNSPRFSQWGGDPWCSEVFRSGVESVARQVMKLKIRSYGAAADRIWARIKAKPNPWMEWSQMIALYCRQLENFNTAFLVPILDSHGEPEAIFPAMPTQCEVLDYGGVLYVRYHFMNGKTACIEKSRCGIMTKYQLQNEFFGDDNEALRPTMDMIMMQTQGISEGIKNAATFRFMARKNNFTKPEDLRKEAEEFNRINFQQEAGGVLLWPNTYSDVKQLDQKQVTVDPEQMHIAENRIYSYIGTNEKIVKNEASTQDLEAFYDGKVEPWAIQFSDVLSGMLLTPRERTLGNRFVATQSRLMFMSNAEKLNLCKEMGDRGAMLIDEMREVMGWEPLPDGAGQHAPIRGEYYMVDKGKEDEKQKEGKKE